MSAGLTFQGRPVPDEGQQQKEQMFGITKVTRIRFFGRWFPLSFWSKLMDLLKEFVEDERLISIRSFRTPRGVILTDVDIAGELDVQKRTKLEARIITMMEEVNVNPRRFLKIEVRERPATLLVSQD